MLIPNLQVGVQGLQIMKPHTQKDIPMSLITVNGVKEFTEKIGGTDLEVSLILSEDNEHELVNWEVENLKFFIRQPVMGISYFKYVVIDSFYLKVVCDEDFTIQNEAVVTKEEVQHLTFLCKSEIDSAGRITAGVLRLFKLEGSVGQSAIDQLGNLGMLPNFLM